MSEPIGALRVDLSANAAQFEKDMGRARKAVSGSGSAMSKAMGGFKTSVESAVKSVFSLKSAAIAAAGAAGLFALAKRAIDTADEIAKTARAIGVTAETLQELRFAAVRSGIDIGAFDSALAGFSKRVGDARSGTGTLVTILNKLSPALLEQVQAADNVEQAFNLIVNAADSMGNELDRNALLAAAFGRTAGVQMANLIQGGTAEIDKLRARARELGIVLSEDVITRAEQAADELDDMGAVLSTAGTAMALEFMPVMQELARILTDPDVIRGARDLGQNLADGLKWVVGNKDAIIAVVGALAGARIGRIAGVPGAVAGAIVGAGVGLSMARDEATKLEREIARLEDRLAFLERFGDAKRLFGPSFREQADETRAKIAQLRGELEALGKKTESTGSSGEIERSPPPPPPPPPTDNIAGAAEEAVDKVAELRRELEFELEQLSRTELGQEIYNLAKRAGVEVTQEFADEVEPLVRALMEEKSAAEESAEAQRAREAILDEGRSITLSVRTATEIYADEIERLNELLRQGAIDQETFNRASAEAAKTLEESGKAIEKQIGAMGEFAAEAARNIQDTLGDQLFNVLQGQFDSIGDQFKATLDRMVADALAAQLASKMFGDFDKTGKVGGWLEKAIGFGASIFGGGSTSFNTAGVASASTMTPSLNFTGDAGFVKLPGFAHGGSFTVGGQAGTDSNVVAFRATRGEQVTVNTPGQQVSGETTVEIVDKRPAGSVVQNFNISGINDARGIREATGNLAARAGAAAQAAMARNG